jgi:hypothetical protein
MSDKATGPYTYKNSIMDGNSNSSGNQPGIFDFKGSTYTTGFTNELWYYYQGGRTTRYERRSASLAKITFNTDGTIPKIPWFGVGNPVPGVPQVGSFNPYDTIQAETICWSKGVRTEVCTDVSGTMDVDSIHNGDYIKVKGVDFKTGANTFIARVASATSGGSIELRLDTISGPLVGTCAVAGTNGWQTWATKSCDVSNASGVHDLYLRFTGGSGLLFNFNWWKFNPLPTGIEEPGIKCRKTIGAIKVAVDAGKTRTLRLDFPEPVSSGYLKIALFDLNGRQVAILFNGRLSSRNLTLPMERAGIQNGAYLVRVSLDNDVVLTNTFIW